MKDRLERLVVGNTMAVIVFVVIIMVMPTMAFVTTRTSKMIAGRPVATTTVATTQRYATTLIKNNNSNRDQIDDDHQHHHSKKKVELKSRLPPIDPTKMSKLEIEFRQLLEGILYTQTEIDAIANPRIRSIYQGISASYYEPAVYRAFEVLYEDYMPLRIAGRLAYSRLQQVMEDSNLYRKNQFEEIISSTTNNLSIDTLQSCWLSYIHLVQDRELQLVNVDDNDDEDGEKILEYITNRALAVAASSSTISSNGSTEIRPSLNLNPTGKVSSLTFASLIMTLDKFASSEVGAQNMEQFFLEVFPNDWEGGDDATVVSAYCASHKLDEKRAKFNARYDEMIHQFNEWKDYIPHDKEGRRIDILKGCFVGSENPDVVQSLRIIYTDNAALRLSGDWIFKVVSTIMKTTIRRRERRKIRESKN